jgi:hypothetical protein
MRAFLEGIRRELTWKGLVVNLMWAEVTTGLVRLALFAFAKGPHKEYLYWLSVSALAFLAVNFLSILSKRDSLPEYRVTLEEVSPGWGRDAQGKQFSFVSVIASIVNVGSPSVIAGLWLTVSIADGPPIRGAAETIPDELVITHTDGTKEVVSGADALNIKAQTHPIPRGGLVRGRMLYVFPGLSTESLSAVGTAYELTVVDVWGRESKSLAKNRGMAGQRLNYPQIQSRFPEQQKPPVPNK